MKKLTCKDLGGPCDYEISADSFAVMGQLSHQHVMEKISAGDQAHINAAQSMRDVTPEQQAQMMKAFEDVFNQAPLVE